MSNLPSPGTSPAFAFDADLARARIDALGLPFELDDYGPQAVLPVPAWPLADGMVCPLADHGLLAANGQDAVKFLQSQLTNDLENLPEGSAGLFGFCNAKGRLQGSFIGWRDSPESTPRVRLVVSLALAEVLRRRLSMFVLRAKLKITDESQAQTGFGLMGEAAAAWMQAWAGAVPEPDRVLSGPGFTLIGLSPVPSAADEGGTALRRWLLWIDVDKAPAAWLSMSAQLQPVPGAVWRWLEIRSGVARIVPGTWELFVPQMINFELVGGVNFKKGCYPGQEVVARSQYLGKLKRRMFRGLLEGLPPGPGEDVTSDSARDPCGQVVLAAPSPRGGSEVLFECQIAAVQAGDLRIAGQPVAIADLPYQLPST